MTNTKKLIRQLNSLAVFENSLSGLCIYDVRKGKYILEYNSDTYFIPASNTKIFSFYSAIKNIGNNIPALYYTETKDSLIVWGSGSPTLLYSEFNDSCAFQFLNNSQKQIYFSSNNFQNKRYGSGWAWDDYNDSYAKENSALSVYGNAIRVTLFPNGEWTVNPKIFRDSIKVNLNEDFFRLKRDEKKNHFELWITETKDTIFKEVPFITSTELSIKLLSDTLHKTIVLIDREMRDKESIETIYGIYSDSIYKVMMRESDNFLAESVLLMSAGNFNQNDSLNPKHQIEYILNKQLSDLSQEPRWVDGSGLSRYNLFTPKSMVEVLLKIKEYYTAKDHNLNRLFEIFPTGGQAGTLEERFINQLPFIHAKTGTLSNNHNLSGYIITKSGKLLVFSYMNNHYRHKTSTIQKQTDIILEDFYKYY
ncbi:MAG: D-alanyl-D-alanine carboxypeptidase [Flavobacteriales bacterium]|nr:D-alanyl-D-alanine carboxypeptidase [Flavobacteriales bacterium]